MPMRFPPVAQLRDHFAEGTDVTIKCVPEVMSEDRARKAGAKLDQEAWLCSVDALSNCDAIIFGTPSI